MKSIAAFLLATIIIVSAGIPSRADQSADSQKAGQLLKQVMTSTQAVHSMTADILDVETLGGKTAQKSGTVKLMKPNFLLEELWTQPATGGAASRSASTPHEILASDGQNYWQIAADGTLFKDTASADGKNVGNTDSIAGNGPPDMAGFITLFFNPSLISQIDPSASLTVTSEDWKGQTYQVISQSSQTKDPAGHSSTITGKLYVGQDNLIHRLVIAAGMLGTLELQLQNLKTDATFTKADFAFTPPSWTKPAPTNAPSN